MLDELEDNDGFDEPTMSGSEFSDCELEMKTWRMIIMILVTTKCSLTDSAGSWYTNPSH